jgi:PilZ domain
MSAEKRRHPRLEHPLEGRWSGASGRSDVRITSLSLGGCFVDGLGTPAVGERPLIELQLRDSPPLKLVGEVVYLSRPQGFAVRFVDVATRDRQALVDGLRRSGLADPYGDDTDPSGVASPAGDHPRYTPSRA